MATTAATRQQAGSTPSSAPEARVDPRLAALHRSVRAAIVIPAVFAVTLRVIGDVQVATFAGLGSFALLVLADFGGPRRSRAVAYATATVTGTALVALGTAASSSLAAGASLMLVVAFVISFAGVFGGYLAAGQTALLLAFVLAVNIPASAAAIPGRLEGWLLAGAVAILAGAFFWPVFERRSLHRRAGEACLAVAGVVEALRRAPDSEDLARQREAARAAVRAMQGEYALTGLRPAGATRRDRAYLELIGQLEEVVDLAERPFAPPRSPSLRPCIDEGDRLVAATTAAIRGSAAVLNGGPPPDIRAVDQARHVHRAALDRWAVEKLRSGRPAEEVVQGVDVDHTLRVIAYVTLALSDNAVIAAGGQPDDEVLLPAGVPRQGAAGIVRRILGTLRTELEPSSTVLHNSLRVAVGLAVAVVVARVLGVGHAFWVVLGTLSVLRSNALGTGRSTVEALAGSVVGVVIGGVFALLAGTHMVVMWAALPIAVFLASYTAGAIGFVAGQAAFSLTVIIIFNLLAPAGWQVGLVRIEDVALGTGISVAAGLVLWPRGARRNLARATAGLYRAVAAYLDHAFGLILGLGSDSDTAEVRARAMAARTRAREAFDAFLTERGAKPLQPQTAGRLVSAGSQALMAADLIVVVATQEGYQATSCPAGEAAVEAQVRTLLAGTASVADELAGLSHDGRPAVQPSADGLRSAAVDCMRRGDTDERAARSAMAVVIAGEWVENLARLAADLDQPVSAAVEAAAIPWWR
jgi:uncharacterized membrane protein YccC